MNDDDDETTCGCLPSTPEVASLGVSPLRHKLEGDDGDDDDATCGCLPSRPRSRA